MSIRDNVYACGRWARVWWRALLAELVATALLVWFGLAAAVPLPPKFLQPALGNVACAFGFVVVGNAVAFGPASGAHMNPAVTLAALVAGRLGGAAGAAYAVAQCLGAVVGLGALVSTLPKDAHWNVTVTQPALDMSPWGAAATEAALTGLLALACCAAWHAHTQDPARPDTTMPVKLGLLVAGLIYAGGPATGASLNPARSLAPALLQGAWTHHWVYWVGPLLGATLGAALHRWVLTTPPPRPRAPLPPEELPLADKPCP